jgi:oligopeptide transport system substrate-binding protein
MVVMILTGCGRDDPPADLVIANGGEPGSLDPATATTIEDLRVCMALFEGLMRVDPVTAQPVPGLAERWEKSPDGRTYHFFLRTNATWSTGERITAHDFVWSWLRVLDPATASEYAGQLFYIKGAEAYFTNEVRDPSQLGIRALDDFTLRVELVNPTAFFLDLCAFQTLYVAPRKVIEKYGDRWMRVRPLPVSGPYQLDQWRLNDRVRLRRNPLYWDAANTHCEVVDLLPLRTASTAFNLYERGAVDIIWDKELIPSELFPVLRGRPDFHSFNYLGTYFLRFNTTRPPLDDARVRKALAMCIDKQRLIDKILKTGELVAQGLVPPYTTNYVSIEGLPFDPAAARKLLEDAGHPGGLDLRIIEYSVEAAGPGSPYAKVGVELQEMWQTHLGVKVELRQTEKQVHTKSQKSLDYDVSRSTWIGDYNDPNTFLDLFRSNNGNNRTGWKDARYDQLMDQAAVQTDLARRAELLREAETVLIRDEAPIVPIYYFSGFNYHNPERVSGAYGNILDAHPINTIQKKKSAVGGRSSVAASANLTPRTADY